MRNFTHLNGIKACVVKAFSFLHPTKIITLPPLFLSGKPEEKIEKKKQK
jgi:hypothetical protein